MASAVAVVAGAAAGDAGHCVWTTGLSGAVTLARLVRPARPVAVVSGAEPATDRGEHVMIYVMGPFGLIFPLGTPWDAVLSVVLLALMSAGWTMWLFRLFQFFRTQPAPAPQPMPTPEPHPGYPWSERYF